MVGAIEMQRSQSQDVDGRNGDDVRTPLSSDKDNHENEHSLSHGDVTDEAGGIEIVMRASKEKAEPGDHEWWD